jgi:hypothetical protein
MDECLKHLRENKPPCDYIINPSQYGNHQTKTTSKYLFCWGMSTTFTIVLHPRMNACYIFAAGIQFFIHRLLNI